MNFHLLTVSGLTKWVVTKFLFRFLHKESHPGLDANGKFTQSLRVWSSGRTDLCRGFDLLFWLWAVALVFIIPTITGYL